MNIFCVGRNYLAHVKELNNAIPDDMVLFMKPATAIAKNGIVHLPSFSSSVHYEGELVLKICKSGKNISLNEASSFYDEITIGIDFTARDVQDELKTKGLSWEKAKGYDDAAVVGKFIPLSSIKNPIQFSLLKNKEIVQRGNSSLMMYDFDTMIVEISKYFSLTDGDLIYTGTPEGVGKVAVGDTFEGYIEEKQLFSISITA